jgi:hypothetical protein
LDIYFALLSFWAICGALCAFNDTAISAPIPVNIKAINNRLDSFAAALSGTLHSVNVLQFSFRRRESSRCYGKTNRAFTHRLVVEFIIQQND